MAAIEQLMAAKGLQPGDRIGAERELADRFGVTRWVVRKALEQLEAEGLILRTNGRSGGVFVAHHKVVRDLDDLVGLPQYLRAQGLDAGTTVLGTGVVPVEPDQAMALSIEHGTLVYRIERLRLAGGLPLSVECVWLPTDLFPGLIDRSLVGSIYELLEAEYSLERGEAIETITAAPADRTQGLHLQVSVGTPLLVVDRVAHLQTGRPFETSKEMYRADRIAITVHASTHGHAGRKLLAMA